MCDIFPEVSSCCFCISLRIGMLLISVIAIVTGAIGLSVMEQRSNIDFKTVQNASHVEGHKDVLRKANVLIPSAISLMSTVFMITGVLLLFGTLWNIEGAVQGFVGITFLNIIVGFVVVITTGLECIAGKSCLLGHMDWLSGAAFLILMIGYLFLWLYFITVASSYVTSVYD